MDSLGESMIINNLTVENISNANEEFLNAFYKMLNGLDKKIINMINSKNVKIILANKISDVYNSEYEKNEFQKEMGKYEDWNIENSDKIIHGVCSDTINALCIFSHTTEIRYIEYFFYHETGHFIDIFKDWRKEKVKGSLSSKKEFVEAYKNDITKHWDKIKNDNRFRLIHYIENSTPDKVSKTGLMETFAFCFARNNGKIDDVDIISDYFQETLLVAKKITDEYLTNLKL